MRIIGIRFAAALALCCSFAADARDLPLLEVAGEARLPMQDPVLAALARDPASSRIQRIGLRVQQLPAGAGAVALDLGDFQVTADLGAGTTTRVGNQVWQGHVRETRASRPRLPGEIASDPANSVTFVRSGDRLLGNLRVHGQLFQVRPIADGSHVLVEVNEALLPPDHPAEYASLVSDEASRSASPPGTRWGQLQPVTGYGQARISVMVVATQAAAQASGDLPALVDLAMAESNVGFANSGVGIQLELAGLYVADYVESGSFTTDLSRFRGNGDGYLDQFHAARDRIGADIGMLVIDDADSCGLASAIGATAATAFAAVHWNCATGLYSFGHEIGHLLAARHDIGSDASAFPHPYGHGYRHAPASGQGWRTVMALECASACPRLNLWSNPGLSYGGVPMGDPATSDNARVLMQRRHAVAAFRQSPGQAAQPLY